ncbi:hypothetical protein BZB76_0800 [Actinomadura pelletieri DSM 43383]|uniref:Uncharacterized protein n=2 Tax=Actinomadura pelletieri TaxID=111805 RepID=A0A495QYP7_9ACTN|nr:hypothetical protein [Actinomadura pelletieri]RKS79339.1 hypothetical protein BZB76_0800 [Actinomadura pelletieri DSM 43383]
MKVTVSIAEAGNGADELRALRSWLVAEDELRGRVRHVAQPPEPGTLGATVEILTVAIESGGAAVALVSALITWLQQRRGQMTVKVTRPDGTSLELTTDTSTTEDRARELLTELLHAGTEPPAEQSERENPDDTD